MLAITAITGIVFTNENAGWTLTPFFCAAATVAWYVSGFAVYGFANELKSPMNVCLPAIHATGVAMIRPNNEKPSRVNMNRFAHVHPAPTAIPATMIAAEPSANCQLWLDASVLPQLTSRWWWPTRPITIRPGATAAMTKNSASNAIDRKLDSEMHDAETVASAGWSVRLTIT